MLFEDPDEASPDRKTLSVSALTALIKATLEGCFDDIWVVGEVSRCTQASSGHMYLTLKDENAVISAVIWRNTASRLSTRPEEGMEVIVRGNIDVYPPRGGYQLIIRQLEPRGLGALQVAFEKLKEKLREEGLFRPEIKQQLPAFPRRIGIVTSPTGAAVRDIINVITRRYPVELLLAPVRVQGGAAAGEIAHAIELLNDPALELDLIIAGRGGGSLEDLWAFNEEVVARAIQRSRLPVVSAVGHEVDFSISDFTADVRAATPTEAGELVVPDRAELLQRLDGLRSRLAGGLTRVTERGRRRLESLTSRYAFRRPESLLRERAQRLDDLLGRLLACTEHRMDVRREKLTGAGSRLEALSPLRVLSRGYSVTLGPDGRVLRDPSSLQEEDRIVSRLHGGTVVSSVLEWAEEPVTNRVTDGDTEE
jgi:exodeoxyribonuclease VII large subunit